MSFFILHVDMPFYNKMCSRSTSSTSTQPLNVSRVHDVLNICMCWSNGSGSFHASTKAHKHEGAPPLFAVCQTKVISVR